MQMCNLHEVFSRKNKKNIISLSLTKPAHSMVSVKYMNIYFKILTLNVACNIITDDSVNLFYNFSTKIRLDISCKSSN